MKDFEVGQKVRISKDSSLTAYQGVEGILTEKNLSSHWPYRVRIFFVGLVAVVPLQGYELERIENGPDPVEEAETWLREHPHFHSARRKDVKALIKLVRELRG